MKVGIIGFGFVGKALFHGLKKNVEIIKIDPHNVKAIDTVGAGDAFAGSFLYGITNGHSFEKSGDLASLLSSKVVSKIGPRLEKKEINSIKNFFK